MIHRLDDLRDLGQTRDREMTTAFHHVEDPPELRELLELRRAEWMRIEERHDPLTQIVLIEDPIHHEVLSVIVVSPIAVDPPAAEELHQKFQGLDASFALNDREPRLHLPTDPHLRTAMDRAAEAAFTVDEADDPSLESWPFLLIARTRQIVTRHAMTL